MLSGSRITHHLKECNHHNYHHHRQLGYGLGLGLGLGFCYTKTSISVSDKRLKNPSSFSQSSSIDVGLGPHFVSCIQSKSPSGEIPILPGAFSQREDDREPPSDRLSSVAGGIVALGKFDALHIGHRELAIQAAKVGVPFLLSFVGMAEVLGWEPRAPIVAKCDRKRVLSSWAPYCCNLTPTEFEIQFSKVRYLSPRQFVEKLSKKLGVCGVVAGKNYRFGFRAAGDASELVTLCEEYGLGAYVIDSVMDKNQSSIDTRTSDSKDQGQVSSTRVRQALAKGNMKYVSELLGRQHRLILTAKDEEITSNRTRISAPKSCLLNLPPKEGQYENCYLLVGDDNVKPCRVVIDMSHIHLDLDEVSTCSYITSQDLQFLGIEFGQSKV